MDIPQEDPEPSDSQSDDSSHSTISYEEVYQPINGPAMDVAPEFHQSVKDAYGDQSKEYFQFLRLMNDLKNRRTNIMVLQLRIRDLFKEHPELVEGFKTFLPVGYEIPAKDQNEYLNVKADDFEDGMTFLTNVKRAYRHDEGRYKSFVGIINRVNTDKNFVEAYAEIVTSSSKGRPRTVMPPLEVCNLFHDRRDLITGFSKFLPKADKNDT